MSYYKIINGIKYDKQLLEVANKLALEASDGHLSDSAIRYLVQIAQDGRGITNIEKATLYYIRQHFKFTATAAAWFDVQFAPITKIEGILQKLVVETFKLPGLRVFATENEVEAQEQLPKNQISFERALHATLESFLTDGSHIESPRSLVENVHEIFRDKFPSEEAWNVALTAKVWEYLNENSYLALHPIRPLTDDEELFNRPEDGESVYQNWIFQLSLRNLSDHIYWAITDRSGEKPTYNYGFN